MHKIRGKASRVETANKLQGEWQLGEIQGLWKLLEK